MIDVAAAAAHPWAEHFVDLPYRLCSWSLDDPSNVALWTDETGRLAAWAVMQLPFWTIDIAVRPDLEHELFPEVLDWATTRAGSGQGAVSQRASWYVLTFSNRTDRIRTLEAAGYACQSDAGEDSWSQVLLHHKGPAYRKNHPLDGGFTIRPLRGPEEIPAYVDLHREAFSSKNMTIEWRERTLTAPHHHRQTDLVALSKGGEFVGLCIGWLAGGDRTVGQIEPMAIASGYRNQGLGTALLSECLARLGELGAVEVLVETDSFRDPALQLYKSSGFEPVRDLLVYRKDFPRTATP